jgi:hypothetical protein
MQLESHDLDKKVTKQPDMRHGSGYLGENENSECKYKYARMKSDTAKMRFGTGVEEECKINRKSTNHWD